MTALDLLAVRHVLVALEFHMRTLLALEPVRLYSIAAAALALAAHFIPTLPVGLVLALVAAVLGVGQKVRASVAPMAKVIVHDDDLRPRRTS